MSLNCCKVDGAGVVGVELLLMAGAVGLESTLTARVDVLESPFLAGVVGLLAVRVHHKIGNWQKENIV